MQTLWMVLAAFLFATMGRHQGGIKKSQYRRVDVLPRRGEHGVYGAGAANTRISLRTSVPAMHAWRSTIGVFSLGNWFYAIAHLPLATAMTLNFMSGIWVSAFIVGGSILYGRAERQGVLMATVLAGFVGVVMMLRPTLDQNQLFAGLIGLISGLGAAMAYLQLTAMGKIGKPEGRTVFYFSVASASVGAIGMAFNGVTPWSAMRWQVTACIVPIGVLASLGQWALTRAFSRGSTLMVASLQYTGIVFAAVYSLVLFGDQIPVIGWAGMALIIASGLAATFLRTRALPDTPAEDH